MQKYSQNLYITEYPFEFTQRVTRVKRKKIGYSNPILVNYTTDNISSIQNYHDSFKQNGFSGLPMHYLIDTDGVIYKGRPTEYRNGYQEHNFISLTDTAKNAIIVTLKWQDEVSFYASSQKQSLINLLSYLCVTEYLTPHQDIYNMSEFFLNNEGLDVISQTELREAVSDSLFPTYNRNFTALEENGYLAFVVPNDYSTYTIAKISKILAMSVDFNNWYPIANIIRLANRDLVVGLKETAQEENQELFAPIEPGTLIIAPKSPFSLYKDSLIENDKACIGFEFTANMLAGAAASIQSEIIKNLE